MVLNFDYEAYFDELKATKPPYKCPFKDCEKVYKTYSGMHFHVINTHKSGSTGDGRSTTSARWHHRQSKSPMTPPKSVSSIENVSLEDINDRYQQSDGEQHDHGKIKCKVKINDKLHKIKDSDKLLVTVSQRSDSSIMDATTNYSLKSSDRTYVEQGSHVEESILKETPKKPTPTPSFRLIKDYYDSPIIHSEFQMPFKDYITFKSPLNGSENENTDYCLDEEDRTWLKMNEAHCKIDETKFETLIDKFEKASYFVTRGEAKLQQHNNSLMSSSLHATCNKPVDDNALCSICYDGSCTSNNTILFCDMCDMGVHQECYGVPYVPEGVWLCRRCLHSPSKELQCCLCPSPGGVLKQTVDGRWAHILCAAWVPEVHFANPVFLEPIDGLDTIPPARWRLMCFLCRRRRVGACIQCHRPNCYTAFHVSCALYAGLHLKMRSRSGSSTISGIFLSNHSIGNVKKSAYCDIHKPMLKLDGHDNDEEDDSEVDGVDIADNDDEYEPMSKAKTEMVMRKRSEMTKAVMLKMKRVVQVLSYPTMPNSCLKMIFDQLDIPHDGSEETDRGLADNKNMMQKVKNYWLLKRLSRNGVPLIRGLLLNLAPKLLPSQSEESANATNVSKKLTRNEDDEENGSHPYKRSFSKRINETPVVVDDDDEDDEDGEEEEDIEKLFVQHPGKQDNKPVNVCLKGKSHKIHAAIDPFKTENSNTTNIVPGKKRGRPPSHHKLEKLPSSKLNEPNKINLVPLPANHITNSNSILKKQSPSSNNNIIISNNNNSQQPRVNSSSRLQYYADSLMQFEKTLSSEDCENVSDEAAGMKRSKRHRRLSSYLVDYTFFKSVKKRKANDSSISADDSKLSDRSGGNPKFDVHVTRINSDKNKSSDNMAKKKNVKRCSSYNKDDSSECNHFNSTCSSNGNSTAKSDRSKQSMMVQLNNVNLQQSLHSNDNCNTDNNAENINRFSSASRKRSYEDCVEDVDCKDGGGADARRSLTDVRMVARRLRNEMHALKNLLTLVKRREMLKMQYIEEQQKLFAALHPLGELLLSTLKQLQGKDHRSFFHKPVDVKEVPDYLDIVSCPMDFSTMKKKIQSQQYFHLRDFQKDFDLIIDNCTLYNAKTTVYYQAALKLKQASISIFLEAEKLQEQLFTDSLASSHLFKYSSSSSAETQHAGKGSDVMEGEKGCCVGSVDGSGESSRTVGNLEHLIESLKQKINEVSCKGGSHLKEMKVLKQKYLFLVRKHNQLISLQNRNDKNKSCDKNSQNHCNNYNNNNNINNINNNNNNNNNNDNGLNICQSTRSSTLQPLSSRSNSVNQNKVPLHHNIHLSKVAIATNKLTHVKQGNKELKQLSLLESFSHRQQLQKQKNISDICEVDNAGDYSNELAVKTQLSDNELDDVSACEITSTTKTTNAASAGYNKVNSFNTSSPAKITQFKDKLKSLISSACIKQLHNNNNNNNNKVVQSRGYTHNLISDDNNILNSDDKIMTGNKSIVFDFRSHLETVPEFPSICSNVNGGT